MKANGAVSSFCLCAAMVACACSAVADITTNVVDVGETLKIETGDELSVTTALILRGTLDLNGHDVNVLSLNTILDEKKSFSSDPTAATDAKIVNSAAEGVATFTVGNGNGGATYFTGSVASNVNFTCNGGEAQIFTSHKAFAPAKFTMKRAVAFAFSRPARMTFEFTDVAAADPTNKFLRMSELMLTARGIPLENWGQPVIRSSSFGRPNWFNGQVADNQYWDSHELIGEEKPAVCTLGLWESSSERLDGYGDFDGYRIGTPENPCYTPTSWKVYVHRSNYIGQVLVDERKDEPITRTEISQSSVKDNWSQQLSQNFEFNRFTLGSPFGEDTDVEIASGATLRISTVKPLKVGHVTGAGTIRIDDGSTLDAKSLTGWTGKFSTAATGCSGFGREAKVVVAGELMKDEFLSDGVLPIGGEASQLVYDASTAGTVVRSRMADGEGALGVKVDVGAGSVQDVANFGVAYSGETKIESGTLRVLGHHPSVTAKYIRIAPKKVPYTGDYYNIHWGMNEFKIFNADGVEVPLTGSHVTCSTEQWNSQDIGDKLIDGNTGTRMLPKDASPFSGMTTVQIELPQAVSFSSYDWYPSSKDGSPTTYRYPTELAIEVSMDKQSWTVVDRRVLEQPSEKADYLKWQGGESHFALDSGTSRELKTLPAAVTGTSAPGASFVESVKAKRFRFHAYETFYGGKSVSATSYGWQISEFSLMKDGKILEWPTNDMTIGTSGCNFYTGSTGFGNKLEKFADNIHTGGTGEKDSTAQRAFFVQCAGYVEVDIPEAVEFDAYSLWNASTAPQRLPRAWTLEVSMDGENWFVIDNHVASDSDVCPPLYGEYGPFSLKNRWPINGANNAIGDRSKVSVAQGAALSLATGFERVGGLAGAGSVYLADSTLSLNACQPATFSGAVSGSGTLEVTGEGTQSFDGADLSAVKTLALNGGAIDGTASFCGNDLTVAFGGGATWAALSGIGALTVTGDVKLALPEDVLRDGGSVTLFSYDSVDAGSKTALEAATVVGGLPRGRILEVVVGEKSTTATVYKNGFMVIVR